MFKTFSMGFLKEIFGLMTNEILEILDDFLWQERRKQDLLLNNLILWRSSTEYLRIGCWDIANIVSWKDWNGKLKISEEFQLQI